MKYKSENLPTDELEMQLEELKREGKTMNVNNVINSQLAESKNSVVETPMYQSEDL